MILDNWQKEILKAKGDILLCSGRRIGKTYIFSRKAIDRMVKKKIPIVIVSLTEDQAMIIHFMALHYLQERYPEMLDRTQTTVKRLTLTNGSVMISRPVGDTGDATRGFEGGVLIVDEASRMPKLFWMAAKPILLTTDGEIWMCSTPFGKKGYFWEKFDESYNLKKKDARFKAFYKSSEEVMNERPISESWTQKQRDGALRILKEDKAEMTAHQYGQEYLGLFLEDLRQFFPDDLIRSCMSLQRSQVLEPPFPGPASGEFYLGVDIARMGEDESTFEIIRRYSRDNLHHVDNIITKQTLTTQTTRLILELERKYNFKQIFLDDGGMGVGVFDQLLTEETTRRKVVAINSAARPLDREEKKKRKLIKEEIYNNLLMLMEKGHIKLLSDDEIFLSLKSVQYEYVEGKIKIFGNYTHIAEGLIRAAWCSKDKSLNIWIR